jgi:tripartite ATP-independent transporter DctM subunit
MSLEVLIIAIVALMFLRVPVAFALLGPCLAYMMTNGASVGLATRTMLAGINSFPLLAVPLFVLVGSLANRSGIAERMFDFAAALLGRLRGGLAYVTLGVNVGFSWMSGSSLADAAAMGKLMVPAMVNRGFRRPFSAGLSASSSLIAAVMPPSIPAILYASIALVSTSALFAASIVPALIMVACLAGAVWWWVRGREDLRGEPFTWRRLGRASLRVIGPAITPVIILGGILAGFFTPSEAAGVAALYVLVLGLSYRSLTVRQLPGIFVEAALTTASVMLILGASSVLGWVLAREQVPRHLAELLQGVTDNQYVFLILVNIVLLLLGIFIEAGPAIVIAVPILYPIAEAFGVDPLHFGVIVIVNLIIGLLSPPVGGVLFVISGVTKTPLAEVIRGVWPFFVPLLAALLIITFVPALSTWLPAALGLG